MPVQRDVGSLQGAGVLDTNTNMDAAVMATAASLFPDPLQTANSEMLFNTMDPLSSINSTMNIHDTFEEGQVGSSTLMFTSLNCFQTSGCLCCDEQLAQCSFTIPHLPPNLDARYAP